MPEKKEQTWGSIDAGSASSLLILFSIPTASSFPLHQVLVLSPVFFPLYLLYVPAGPAPRSLRSTALPSTTEAASCGLQDGAAHRQMSWQGRIRGLEEVHCRCHQPGIQLPNSIKLLLRVSKLKSLRGYHLASSCFPGDSKRGLLDTGDASFSKAWKKHDF